MVKKSESYISMWEDLQSCWQNRSMFKYR